MTETERLLVADTSWRPYGVAAKISRIVAEFNPVLLRAPVLSPGMADAPCPTAKALEDLYYPDLHLLIGSVARLVRCNDHKVPIPAEKFMTGFYKHFRGPF